MSAARTTKANLPDERTNILKHRQYHVPIKPGTQSRDLNKSFSLEKNTDESISESSEGCMKFNNLTEFADVTIYQ